MLSLPMQTRGDLIVMPDHDDPKRVYVALTRPRLSKASDGRPSLRLVHWRALEASRAGEREVGGHLFVEIEVEPMPEELATANLAGLDVQPMPWLEAHAVLDVQGAEAITSEASVVAGGRAAFAMRLSTQQVNLLAPQLEADAVAPIQVTWVGQVRARMPEAEVIATVNVEELRSTTTRGNLSEIHSLLRSHARVEITGSTDADLEAALREWALGALGERIEEGGSLSVRTAAAEVRSWPIRISSTLDLGDLQAEDSVTALVLAPDQLETPPPLRIQARGDFDGIDRVDVELRVAEGELVPVALRDEIPAWVEISPDELTWRHRVVARSATRPWSTWREVFGTRDLVIPVVPPPPRSIEVLLAGLDLRTRWASVRVELSAIDARGGARSHVVQLREDMRSGTWQLPEGSEGSSVQARVTFLSMQGLSVQRGPYEVEHEQVVLDDPFGSYRIGVALMPTGLGWDALELAMVDLRHTDEDWVHERAVELRSLGDFRQVELPARPGGSRSVSWRVHASFADGRFAQSEWAQSEAAVILVALPEGPAPG